MPEQPFSFAAVGALYPATARGLTADILTGHALGGRAWPICTAIVMAANGVVTDFTEVPEDTIRAQIEHLEQTVSPSALKVGVLASHGAATAVLEAAERWKGPAVLDLQMSGPQGETVLSQRGLNVVLDRFGAPDLVLVDRTDAELASGGEIQSLDDAQVAAQRLIRRGARRVLIKCGHLPARHFEAEGGNGVPNPQAADLYYDGVEFALFEAPHLPNAPADGASSVHAVALLKALHDNSPPLEALQHAKRFITEALRHQVPVGGTPSLSYFWNRGLEP